MVKISSLLTVISVQFSITFAQKISYLNGIEENERCRLSDQVYGSCKKITECIEEYEKYRKNQTVLKICKFNESNENSLVCCPQNQLQKLSINPVKAESKKVDFTDYDVCKREHLKFRVKYENIQHYLKYILSFNDTVPEENCEKLKAIRKKYDPFRCDKYFGSIESLCNKNPTTNKSNFTTQCAYFAFNTYLGEAPNMAAIGWTRKNKIYYRCGGSILNNRFILTAAHCKFFDRYAADTVRVGDRFLVDEKDDENAQQLMIENFILHPEYKSLYYYNDIALIKTVETIVFTKFVVPSCIIDVDFKQNMLHYLNDNLKSWIVTGYGETENGTQSNELLKINAYHLSTKDCNKFYENDPSLPNGIAESQFCVKGTQRKDKHGVPDTCNGDSGSPLQMTDFHEVFQSDFNTTHISDVYEIYGVMGLVSFGFTACGYNAPSVYTKLSFYRDWIRTTVENN